ncbi:OLC1v1033262C1 [Oldenlandia corymbosa var. corymbosa]|uniref:Terpene cyclase/mutase family member n=1 Tax=Oldenlandia corymbosa var. corymbosa TaxID=529605 RepID=A0AAV1CPE4_OLDCO|nr:OLC1v1033262C1 [Oldenlandia corymbosa var. corymbosa]
MWRLQVATEADHGQKNGDINNSVGTCLWKFDADAGTPQERAQVENLRDEFRRNRFHVKLSANRLLRMQMEKKEMTRDNSDDTYDIKLTKEDRDVTKDVVTESLKRGLNYYSQLQAADGHWPCDMLGPLFIGPTMVLALYITGDLNLVLSSEHQKEMKRYIYNHQNEDGGWGLNVEGHSTMFSSVMNYLALRLMGENLEEQDDTERREALALAQKWIIDHGTAIAIPSWGKYLLAILGVYEWSGCNPVPPEFWLLPSFSPISPGKMLSFCRLVYLPLSYLYGKRFVGKTTKSIVRCLREELYTEPYEEIDWIKARDISAKVRENPSGDFTKMYRHATKGAWTFSAANQKWQVSDCTGEGLKAALLLSLLSPTIVGEKLSETNLHDAVNIILSIQSPNGGFPAWEPARASRWVESLNPIEFFEDTLIEREYVECTSSAVQALLLFSKLHPGFRKKEIQKCISKALQYIEDSQNSDGSWYGRWGVCFTYGTWFAVEALVAGGRNYENCSSLRRACSFLLSKQLPCGGWGESYLSCHNKVYTNLDGERPHAVQTAWALLALIKAGQLERDAKPINRAVKTLINMQMPNGDFPQQENTGAFMRYCMLNYTSYRNIFPLWALGEYRSHVSSFHE